MPTLEFKGKQHVYAHHLTVPYRPLVPDADKSHGDMAGQADDNLIIYGDNLDALKALLPRYAGQVDCIYIDPPYNTGNEGWHYNDNVNSPLMRDWLKQNGPVDGEDLERHDKWLCMMWPRLQILRELLAEDGKIFVSIDENEEHHLRMMMDETFGEPNFLNAFTWVNNLKGRQLGRQGAARTSETILAYCKDASTMEQQFQIEVAVATKLMPDAYRMREYDELRDDVGPYVIKNELHNTNSRSNEETSPSLVFNIHYSPNEHAVRFTDAESDERFSGFALIRPHGNNNGKHRFHAWRWSREKIESELDDLHFEPSGDSFRVYTKIRDFTVTSLKDVITNLTNGNNELKSLSIDFASAKPSGLPSILISAAAKSDALILDSFAGSGTTAHAVLGLNHRDGGHRKFILIECEDYADSTTAERVRRVIDGVTDARIAELRDGFGGSFTYCVLGRPIELEAMLSGDTLPEYSALAAYLLHTASGISVGGDALEQMSDDGLFYETESVNYYLLYEPEIEWLRSNDGVVNEPRADRIEIECKAQKRKAIVFAPAKYMSQSSLSAKGITFCQLPYELHNGG